jgi:integrase/recombinase XerD
MNRCDQFIKERKYLLNVSPSTISWYQHAFKWLPSESPSEPELKMMVMRMRERGLKPTGCNAVIRAVNCYLRWSGSTLKIAKLKEPEFVIQTFTEKQVRLLLGIKPKNDHERRLHLLVLLLFDTGCRISEALGIAWADVDWDNLLLTLHGKGRKDRIVPISMELRKALWKHKDAGLWTFGRCAALRSVKSLCRRLGFEPPSRTLHSFRHTFGTAWIRRGGSVAALQRILGHTTITMSMRYVHLQTDDLAKQHQQISMLNRKA